MTEELEQFMTEELGIIETPRLRTTRRTRPIRRRWQQCMESRSNPPCFQ